MGRKNTDSRVNNIDGFCTSNIFGLLRRMSRPVRTALNTCRTSLGRELSSAMGGIPRNLHNSMVLRCLSQAIQMIFASSAIFCT